LGGERPEHLFVDWIAARRHARLKKELLLDVGSQVQQVHDLGHPGLRHLGQPSQLRQIRRDAGSENLKAAGVAYFRGSSG
jgi:hypothetical protein